MDPLGAPTQAGGSRPLNTDERRILRRLLEEWHPWGPAFLLQLPHARALPSPRDVSVCISVDDASLAVDGAPTVVPAETKVLDDQGRNVGGIVVSLRDGLLSGLGAYGLGEQPVEAWPSDDRLFVMLDQEAPPGK